MKIRVLHEYNDLQLKRKVEVDEILDVSEERAKELTTKNNRAQMILAEVIKEKKKAAKVKDEPA